MKKIYLALVFSLSLVPSLSFASINVDLSYGMSGSNVIALQKFLISQKLLQSSATGAFYTATLKAVKLFQSNNKISPTGYVGPTTRAKINSILTSGVSVTSPAAQMQTPTIQVINTTTSTAVYTGPAPTCSISGSVQRRPVAYTTDPVTGDQSDSLYGYSGTVTLTSSNATAGSLYSYYSGTPLGFPIQSKDLASSTLYNLSLNTTGDHATSFVGNFSNAGMSTQCTLTLVAGSLYPIANQDSTLLKYPIYVSANSAVTSTTTPINTKNVLIGSYIVQANSLESLKINDIFIGLNGAVPFNNFKNITVSQNIKGVEYATSYQYNSAQVNEFPESLTIPAGQSVTFDVFADIGSAVGIESTTMTVQGQGAGNSSTNPTGIFYSGTATGQSMTMTSS